MQTFLTCFFIDIRFTEAPTEENNEPAAVASQSQSFDIEDVDKIEKEEAEVVRNSDEQSNLIKDEIKREMNVKVSTGCGPSPDREIEEIFANENIETTKPFTPLREIPSRSSRVSIGTSPPPQSISTQVTTRL